MKIRNSSTSTQSTRHLMPTPAPKHARMPRFSRSFNRDYDDAVSNDTPEPRLAVLATSTYDVVRRHVAEHPNTSVGTLQALALDSDAAVRQAASDNLNRSTVQVVENIGSLDW